MLIDIVGGGGGGGEDSQRRGEPAILKRSTPDAVVRRLRLLGGVPQFTPCSAMYISRKHVELPRPAFERLFGIDSRFKVLYEAYSITYPVYIPRLAMMARCWNQTPFNSLTHEDTAARKAILV